MVNKQIDCKYISSHRLGSTLIYKYNSIDPSIYDEKRIYPEQKENDNVCKYMYFYF